MSMLQAKCQTMQSSYGGYALCHTINSQRLYPMQLPDRILGDDGNDILSDDSGDDIIRGGAGNDILMGVTGNDILVGDNKSSRGGADVFVFGNGDGTDIIRDFEVGIDQIGLVEGELTFEDLTITQ
ncbi:MAG: hypothetical protein AAFN12_18510, partial [Cyanobacteria bacterium J06560_2]